MTNKSDKTLLGTSILAAITASLCCIAPLLALAAGVNAVNLRNEHISG
ncbi:MAG: hypothetical protein L3J41_09485 [Melioribacteraceae bacterium]|nr:hypothetical protein [Melioribacteraceae bacterium]